jgi:thiol:disulfide interchange protein
MRALLVSLLLLVSSFSYAQGFDEPPRAQFGAANNPQFLPVEEAYQLEVEILDAQQVRLYWQIADSYYLYQHRFAFTLGDSAGLAEEVDVKLPPALQRSDEYFGEVQVYYNSADIILRTQGRPQQATLTVSSQGCADAGLCYPPQKQYFKLDFSDGTVRSVAPPAKQSVSQQSTDNSAGVGALLYMLLLAFVGGSILNLMPCVFPILSLKVLGFARSTQHDRHLESWVYTAGVVASIVLVAAVLITLQKAGSAIGWGFQLQSPGFVIALAYLFVTMGLSLSGLVQLGGSVMNAGSGLAGRRFQLTD